MMQTFHRTRLTSITVAGLMMLCAAAFVRADSIAWKNPVSGIWSAGPNWVGELVPGMDDTAVISAQDVNAPDYTVTLDINTTVSGLAVSTLTGGLDISGVTFNVTNAAQVQTAPVRAINSNTTFGSLVNATNLTLLATDGNNTFTVDGSASNSNEILLRAQKQASSSFFSTIANFNGGLLNQGTLAFQPNVLTSGSSQGQVNVTGTLTNQGTILYRAGVGAGSFEINADVLNNIGTIASEVAQSIGFRRTNAAYTNSGVISSRFNILRAGSFNNTATGQITGSFVTIDGNGHVTNDGEFWVETTRPFAGAASFINDVRFSGGLTNHGIFEGRPKSGAGVIARRVNGAIDNHGTIVNNDSTELEFRGLSGSRVVNTGLVDAAAGDISFQFISTFNNTGVVHTAAGRTVTTGGSTSSFVNQIGGVISGHGTLVTQGSFTDHGTITPGSSPGILTIEAASYTQAADAVLELEIMGLIPGSEHDQIIINSPDAVFNGSLRLVFLDDFAPQQDDVFEFIIGDADFNFDQIEIINLAPGFMYDLDFDGGSLNLTALNDGKFAIPEPATIMLSLFLIALTTCRRRPSTVATLWRSRPS